MKHDLALDLAQPHRPTVSGGLLLLPVQKRQTCGSPLIKGHEDALALEPVPDGDPASFLAVCKEAQMDGRLVVIGYVSFSQIACAQTAAMEQGEIIFGTEKAQIRLTADGRIRIRGEDVLIESRTRMALSGASIDLN